MDINEILNKYANGAPLEETVENLALAITTRSPIGDDAAKKYAALELAKGNSPKEEFKKDFQELLKDNIMERKTPLKDVSFEVVKDAFDRKFKTANPKEEIKQFIDAIENYQNSYRKTDVKNEIDKKYDSEKKEAKGKKGIDFEREFSKSTGLDIIPGTRPFDATAKKDNFLDKLFGNTTEPRSKNVLKDKKGYLRVDNGRLIQIKGTQTEALPLAKVNIQKFTNDMYLVKGLRKATSEKYSQIKIYYIPKHTILDAAQARYFTILVDEVEKKLKGEKAAAVNEGFNQDRLRENIRTSIQKLDKDALKDFITKAFREYSIFKNPGQISLQLKDSTTSKQLRFQLVINASGVSVLEKAIGDKNIRVYTYDNSPREIQHLFEVPTK